MTNSLRLRSCQLLAAMIILLVVYAGVFLIKSSSGGKNSWPALIGNDNHVALRQGVSQEAIDEMLSKREYHISYDKQNGDLQSPNRKQNLRARYKPGAFTIENRVDSAGHNFKLNLTTKGIFADGRQIFEPQKDAITEISDNTLKVKHTGFTEEYINNEQGIRQNFIIESAPMNTKEVQVHLLAEGLTLGGSNAKELYFSDEKSAQLIYKDLNCWDANHSPLSAKLIYANNEIQLSVDVQNAVYPVMIDPLVVNGTPANANKLLEGNQVDANFGLSVRSAGDVNGDGYSDVIAGAPYYDNGQHDEGAAFVFYGSSNGIGSVPSVVLESNLDDSYLGYEVAGAGDVNGDGYSDIIAGAPEYNQGQVQEGAVFIYYGSKNGVKPAPSAILESNLKNAGMGMFIASAGDVNSDGFSDIIAGAPFYSNGQLGEGAFFVYLGSAAGINVTPSIMQESNISGANMGSSVAGAGDINADGFSDIVVGVPRYTNGQVEEGVALVYYGSAVGVKTSTVTFLEYNQTGAHVGSSVSSAGDVNGDGYSDLIVGAAGYDGGNTDEGAAFIYLGSAGGIALNPATTLEANENLVFMGHSVASAGDVNGDGYSDVIVGRKGFAFVFQGSQVGISQVPVSTISNTQGDASLGRSVASAGDVNGDGYSDIIVGADTYDHGEQDEGIALVFHGGASGISTSESAAVSGSSNDGQLGFSVSSAGDVNGDGYDDVVIGAPYEAKGEPLEGIAYVYYGSGSGINLANPVVLQVNVAGAHFGLSVSTAGDVNGDGYADVVVGAEKFNNSHLEEGAFYLFLGSPAGLATLPVQYFEGNMQYARLGCAVSSAGDLNGDGYGDVVIGARGYTNGQDFEGALFIYYGSSTGVNATPTIIETNQVNGYLGTCVSNAGDVNGDGYGDVIASVGGLAGVDVGGGMAAIIFHGSAAGIATSYQTAISSETPASLTAFAGSLSVAGDVNGDGFSDIIIGADDENGGAGAVRIYHGSLDGVITSPATVLNGNEQFGWSVSSAGDVNGDGYSDVMVASRFAGNGQLNEGAAFVFHGSPIGIKTQVASKVETNQANAGMWTVSDAGDVNGDGYSDVMAGSLGFDNGAVANAGKVVVYQGNNDGGLRSNIRLYNNDNLSTNINQDNIKETGFGFGLFGKPFLGRGNVKLLWETRKEGEGFSHSFVNPDSPITNSTAFTDIETYSQSSNGTEAKYITPKLGKATKIRARFKYDITRALTGQVYSPWRYLSSYSSGNILNQSGALPVKLVFFTAQPSENKVLLEWQTASESNSDRFEIEHSDDGKTWNVIGQVKSSGESSTKTDYSFQHCTPVKGTNFYRLKMVDQDETFALSRIRTVNFGEEDEYVFYPNPVLDWLFISETKRTDLKRITIFNSSGNQAVDLNEHEIQTLPNGAINFQKFPSGVYIISATNRKNLVDTFKIVKK